jgi:hypothetical protein
MQFKQAVQTHMPRIDFATLPPDARLWVFAFDPAPASADALLRSADDFLGNWHAHGNPLTCAREWRDGRFLAIAVDQRSEGASGCSIDGLFRTLRSLEQSVGSRFVGGGSVFYRTQDGNIACVTRDEFTELAERGEVTATTPVFDATVITAGDWRENFERTAGSSWHASLLPASAG